MHLHRFTRYRVDILGYKGLSARCGSGPFGPRRWIAQRRAIKHRARLFEPGVRLYQPMLQRLEGADCDAKLLAFLNEGESVVEQALAKPDEFSRCA